jgi:predicted acetyltransferase
VPSETQQRKSTLIHVRPVDHLRLRPLRPDDAMQARIAHQELAREGFEFLLDWAPDQPWSGYLHRLEQWRRGLDVPPDRVPATFLIAQACADLVGRVSIRHRLNEALTNVGGHIGFGVRPGYRGHGHAGEILRQALIVVRAEGIDHVLLTCDEDNLASRRVIERAGGVLEDTRRAPDGKCVRRYWIA